LQSIKGWERFHEAQAHHPSQRGCTTKTIQRPQLYRGDTHISLSFLYSLLSVCLIFSAAGRCLTTHWMQWYLFYLGWEKVVFFCNSLGEMLDI
jgi:hypothetical protein